MATPRGRALDRDAGAGVAARMHDRTIYRVADRGVAGRDRTLHGMPEHPGVPSARDEDAGRTAKHGGRRSECSVTA